MKTRSLALRSLILSASVLGAGLVCACLATVIFGGNGGDPKTTLPGPADEQLVSRGRYVAILGDCAACHSVPGRPDYAGGLPIGTPIGTVYTTNITPDEQHGIGGYSLGDFERAVRRGIRRDGTSLYPAMPFPSYSRISDADLKALYAYFMGGVRPADQADRAPSIAWPLSMRWPLTYWRWAFAPTPAGDAGQDQLARGAYLVEGLGHCGTCHTPRGAGLEERALSAKDGPLYLSGGAVDHYVASNLRGDALTGLGSWSEADIVEFLQTGRTKKSGVFGGMTDVVTHSTQSMTREDLAAIAHYLKSLPSAGGEAAFKYEEAAATTLSAGQDLTPAGLDYLNNCAACHLSSGRGYEQVFPALAGNPVVNAADPTSLVNIVLTGATVPSTGSAPSHYSMPGFGARLSDEEVADVVTFIRSSWGNEAAAVSPGTVGKLRAALDAPQPERGQ
jgi:alcohol dehydrogenase (quinone), cytochrome c subunit